jgi:hypothetical protein
MALFPTFNRRAGGGSLPGASREGSARVARERLLFHLRQADHPHHHPNKNPSARGKDERFGAEVSPCEVLRALLVRDVSC